MHTALSASKRHDNRQCRVVSYNYTYLLTHEKTTVVEATAAPMQDLLVEHVAAPRCLVWIRARRCRLVARDLLRRRERPGTLCLAGVPMAHQPTPRNDIYDSNTMISAGRYGRSKRVR